MTLEPGHKLGPYEIISAAGAGGMGEVYRAKDTRLDRTVAIKVLPARTAGNADLRARFEREAKAISSLNHPNICTLHDVGHEDGIDYIVMEFLEGETIGDRLKKGSMDIHEALEIGVQIADALDKAHRQGLVHRDLKPANVILTKEGAKLLDFGLAKLTISGGVVEGVSGVTQTTPLTGTGTIIGTIQYMAPEQLEGSEADARSDIFAFGAVLYQMVSGQRPFEGKSQASLIAAIIERTPTPISQVAPMTPPGLDRLIKKCLAKDPDERWQSARDMADELRWISQSGSQAGIPAPVAARRKFKLKLGWTVAAVAILLAGFYAYKWYTHPAPEAGVIRFSIEPDKSIEFISWPQISPNGSMISYRGADTTGATSVWVRPLNANESYMLKGTQDALRAFWSPDSKYLAYTAGDQLKKISVGGGPSQLIGEFPRAADGAWGSSNTILFDGGPSDSLRYVSASGGNAKAATVKDSSLGESLHAWPEFLPDGEHFLYLATSDTAIATANFTVCVGSLSSHEQRRLFDVDSKVEYAEPGYILYVREKILLARPFDADKLELTGEPIPVAEDLNIRPGSAIAPFDVSDQGTLIFMTSATSSPSELIWVDRRGVEIGRIDEAGSFGDIAISPDGKRLVFGRVNPASETYDLWMHDLERNVTSRFTFEDLDEFNPIWSHDGNAVYFSHGSYPRIAAYRKPSNGTGTSERLLPPDFGVNFLSDISPDDKLLSITYVPSSSPDICLWDVTKPDTKPIPIVEGDLGQFVGEFSPDGKMFSYIEQDQATVLYLKKLSGEGGKWQVSSDAVYQSEWNPVRNEIIFVDLDFDFYSVSIDNSNGIQISKPKRLFKHRLSNSGLSLRRFAISPDGEKFLLVSAIEQEERPEIHVILNWTKLIDGN